MKSVECLEAGKVDPEILGALNAEEYDRLPFGAIELDRDGRVVSYNATEARFSRRSIEETVGKLFFEEIAPCTNVEDFRGRIEAMLRAGKKTTSFDFHFRFPWGERDVRIRVLAREPGGLWVFVTDFACAPGSPASPSQSLSPSQEV